jgi:hypothetical protein
MNIQPQVLQGITLQPLVLLPYQSGLIQPPLTEESAQGNSSLDVTQRAALIGAPIPLVFGRRISNAGGVFVSPAATEARYTNDATTNELTVSLALVLSEGELPLLQLRDVFQRACRVGTWAQAFEDRAGTWTRGNFTTTVAGKTPWDCPYYCGTGGNYGCMTTLSYVNTFADGDDTWDKQVHVFVREGMQVNRILDSTYGPSNNFVDLALYLLRQSERIPTALIDTDLMAAAALFCNVNGFFCNGVFEESTNLEDWLVDRSADFLLRIVDKQGKKALRPRIPTNVNGSINTSAISWVFGFTEEHLTPDGFEIEYIPLSERKPICAQMLWRQQPEDDIGIVRTAEVRLANQAIDGPYEQYDLSQFCATENHAVKIGTFRVIRRQYITHTLRIRVKPDAYNGTLILGDIVRVLLRRETNANDVTYHDYLYEVERIDKALSGVVTLDLTHFPIDSEGRSITALAVNAAVGDGVVVPTGRSNFSCDVVGRREDSTTLLAEQSNGTGEAAGAGYDGGGGQGSGYGGGGNTGNGGIGGDGYGVPSYGLASRPSGGISNPSDPVGQPIGGGITGTSVAGSTLQTQPVCDNAQVNWYRIPKNADTWNDQTGEIIDYSAKELTSTEVVTGGNPGSLVLTTDDIDYIIYVEWRCADPSAPDGFGMLVPAGNSDPVEPDTTQYQYARWTGTIFDGLNNTTTAYTSGWRSYSSFLTIGGAFQTTPGPSFAIEGKYEEFPPQFWLLPPTGPSPWRASVEAFDYSGGFGGFPKGLGFLGIDANPAMSLTSPKPGFTIPNTTDVGVTYAITGKWQFSNDEATVLVEWGGDTSSSSYEEPVS